MKIRKRPGIPVRAFCLGEGSPLETQLMEQGLLRLREDGVYEVFSREAAGSAGEEARPGDFVKLDGGGMPYPNEREVFLRSHEFRNGVYSQRPVTITAWRAGEPLCEELEFLLREGRLLLDPSSDGRYFTARLWGTELTAPRDAVLVFYELERNADGAVTNAGFNFVVREEFDASYEILAP